MANAVDKKGGFDNLPVFVQLIIGIVALLLIAVIGFAIFYAMDILLLDFDPIGKAISGIAGAIKG